MTKLFDDLALVPKKPTYAMRTSGMESSFDKTEHSMRSWNFMLKKRPTTAIEEAVERVIEAAQKFMGDGFVVTNTRSHIAALNMERLVSMRESLAELQKLLGEGKG